MEWFHVPSRCCVAASLIAGRCEYGSQSRVLGDGSVMRATSAIDRYLMGADPCSSSQLRGKVSGSGAGVVIPVGIKSGATLGAVKIGARCGNMADETRFATGSAGRIAYFRPEARGGSLSYWHISV